MVSCQSSAISLSISGPARGHPPSQSAGAVAYRSPYRGIFQNLLLLNGYENVIDSKVISSSASGRSYVAAIVELIARGFVPSYVVTAFLFGSV